MKHGPFGYLFGIAVVVYIGWIVFATSPMDRIERGCQPICWAGNLSVSVAGIMNPAWEAGTQHAFYRSDYVCTWATWRLIYGNAWQREHKGKPLPAEGSGLGCQEAGS